MAMFAPWRVKGWHDLMTAICRDIQRLANAARKAFAEHVLLLDKESPLVRAQIRIAKAGNTERNPLPQDDRYVGS